VFVVRPLLPALALLAAALALAACGSGSGGGRASSSPTEAKVVRVVDGDTIVVAPGGRVRYIGIDTPESVKPGTPVQCFAERASAFNRALLPAGERVRLVYDREHRDRYGRLLAYVYRVRDGLDVNAELVRRGYARTLTIPPDTAHAGRFAALASDARRAGKGLWHACRR
jgi:micrococcal nuclease